MGSNLNFKNVGNELPAGGGHCGKLPPNTPLARQSSVYSLTFDEFQSTLGGSGKDFGSMNMDELLKSIWSAEDIQNFGAASGGGGGGDTVPEAQEGRSSLQRQGSLILPRTLSQKTVDEVWRDMSKEGNVVNNFNLPQRQPTLGEITLEEFLARAGVVREEAQLASNNAGFFGDMWHPVTSGAVGLGFQQQQQTSGVQSATILPLNVNGVSSAPLLPLSVNGISSAPLLPLSVNGVTSAGLDSHQILQQQQQQRQHQQILPKQTAFPYGIPTSGQLRSPSIRKGIVGISDTSNQAGGIGMAGLGGNVSPSVSSEGLSKSNGDTSSVSPVPYVLNGGLRGRKSAALEKVVERRQKRMIKNRESAARSRARKQAYTTELEAEVAKLKEENEQLQKKQEHMMEMQKNQVMEMLKQQNGAKRQCLRRTQTGPW